MDEKQENIYIGKLLRDARESCGVTQAEMMDATDLSKNHISAVERGVSKVSVHVLLGYCKKLDMTPNEILLRENIIPELKEQLNGMSTKDQMRVVKMIELMKNE